MLKVPKLLYIAPPYLVAEFSVNCASSPILKVDPLLYIAPPQSLALFSSNRAPEPIVIVPLLLLIAAPTPELLYAKLESVPIFTVASELFNLIAPP